VKNFRSLADVDVTLGPLTVLVGPNAAGKSAFVDALCFVRDALTLGLETAVSKRNGFSAFLRREPTPADEIEFMINAEANGWGGSYSFALVPTEGKGFRVKHEICSFGHESFEATGDAFSYSPTPDWPHDKIREALGPTNLLFPIRRAFGSPSLNQFYHDLADSLYYAIYPNKLRDLESVSDKSQLGEAGENLSSCLQDIKKTGEWYRDLLQALERITGDIKDFRVIPTGQYLITELKHDYGDTKNVWLELSQESDGTLRSLALLAALYQKNGNALRSIEEPEISLYPGVFALFGDILKEASRRNQILITTQSPDLISQFKADDLRIVEKVNGKTRIGPLWEAQRDIILRDLFSSGDLLRIEGLRPEPVATGGDHA